MSQVADYVLDRLRAWGVQRVFGYPGDGINGMLGVIDRAFKTALSTRGVSTIIIPEDIQEAEAAPSPPKGHGAVYSSVGWSPSRVLPDENELRRAADILNSGRKVAMLIGQGAADA